MCIRDSTEAEHTLNCEIHRVLVNTSSDVQVKSETEEKSHVELCELKYCNVQFENLTEPKIALKDSLIDEALIQNLNLPEIRFEVW